VLFRGPIRLLPLLLQSSWRLMRIAIGDARG